MRLNSPIKISNVNLHELNKSILAYEFSSPHFTSTEGPADSEWAWRLNVIKKAIKIRPKQCHFVFLL